GYLRFRNDSEHSSLYFSWNGISTFVDGVGGDEDSEKGQTSGSIFWWDKTYSQASPATSGITVYSWGGTATLESERHHALSKSRYSTNIESDESNINIMPYSGDNKREFTFTKDGDRLTGKMKCGNGNKDDYYGGLRFGSGREGSASVIDTSSSTGGDTAIEAGIGEFNELKRRDGNRYLDIASSNHLRVGTASNGDRRIEAPPVYARTTSSGSNVNISN